MMMRVFYFEGADGSFERWLELEGDGSMTYSASPNRYASMRGAKGEFTKLSVNEAKNRWPQFRTEIRAAVYRLVPTGSN